MVLLSTPPPAYGASRKTTQEKKRRDEINAKIKELQLLIQHDSDHEKMTQGDILNRAVEVVNRMETESPGPSTNPNRKGFFDGFAAIESLTYSFIKGLGVNSEVCQDFINRAKKNFDRERSTLLVPNSGSPNGRKSGSPVSSEPGSSGMDRKEIKKNREQDRRDKQGEAFEALKNFIISNKLMSSHQVEKMQRLNTLDIIINYIKNKRNNFISQNGQDQTLYSHAVTEGQKTARLAAFNYFKSDRHLTVRCADLEKYLDFSLQPKPLVGFPTGFPICPPLYPFRPAFPFFPIVTPTTNQHSPSYSMDSPPPSSDTSSSSIESTTPNENSNVTRKIKVFRPWE